MVPLTLGAISSGLKGVHDPSMDIDLFIKTIIKEVFVRFHNFSGNEEHLHVIPFPPLLVHNVHCAWLNNDAATKSPSHLS